MRIIKRLKRALAGFLKDELQEYTNPFGVDFEPMNQKVIIDEIGFDTYTMERIIDVDREYYSIRGLSLDDKGPLSFQIDRVKAMFADKVVEHTHVDFKELTNPAFIGKAAIRLTLRVQAKQK
jgi:hypothetical protein